MDWMGIAHCIDEELGVIYPEDPVGRLTDLLSDKVLQLIADRIRIQLGVNQACGGQGRVGTGGQSL